MKSHYTSWSKQSLLPIVLMILAFLAYDLQRTYQRDLEFTQRNNENIANVLDGHLNSSIGRIDIALTSAIAELTPKLKSRKTQGINERLKNILDQIPESQSLRIVDPQGHVIFDASGTLPQVELADRKYFIANRDNPQAGLVISEPLFARITFNSVITLSRQFRDEQGHFLGLIQAAIRADYFSKFYSSLNMGSRGLISLITRDYQIFARIPELQRDSQNLPPGELQQQIDNGRTSGHYQSYSPIDGVFRFLYFTSSHDYPFTFVVGTAQDDALSEFYWKVAIYTVFTLLIFWATYAISKNWHNQHQTVLNLAEQLTQKSQLQTERLMSIINATQVGTWEWNIQTGALILNERWAEILGYRLSELDPIGVHTWFSSLHPEDRQISGQRLEQHFLSHTPYYECEVRMRHARGTWVWVLIRGQVTRWSSDGNPLWMFGTQQDISAVKALEFSLKDLVQDHERLIQNIPVGVYRYKMPTEGAEGFTYVSQRWCEQMALSAQQALKSPLSALRRIHPQDRKALKAQLAQAKQQQALFFWEGRIFLPNREIRWARIEAQASVQTNGSVLWNGIQSDITDRAVARQAQAQVNALQKALLDNSAVGVFLTSWDRRIEQVSHRVCELFGYSVEELIGQSAALIHVDTEHFEAFACTYTKLAEEGGNLVHQEYPFRHRSGRIFWCETSGIPLDHNNLSKGVVWTFLDVDEKRRLAAELENQRRTLSDILNTIPAAVSYWDSRDAHNIYNVFSNQTFASWYQTTPEALVGIHVRDLLGEPTYNEHWHRMAAARLGEPQVYDRKQPEIPNRPVRYAQVHYIPDIQEGEPRGIYVMMFDTTRMRESEMAMKAAKEIAEEAAKAKGDFLANMSHEIRTPMNAVLGLLELLQHTPLTSHQRSYTSKAHAAAHTLLGIINDILDFSKVESGKLEIERVPLVLHDVLYNLSVIVSAASTAHPIEVIFDVDPNIPEVLLGDPLRLQQVLLNLTGNAIKFTHQGEVILRLHCLSDPNDTQQVSIEFSVQDTGIGIASDKLERIFEGFHQAEASTTRHYGGTGLGLAISQRLVALMGGKLCVESTLGQGSRFYFNLTLKQTEAAPTLMQGKKRNLLLIDDNPAMLRALEHTVMSLGWQTTQATGIEEAIRCLQGAQETHQPFDLILLDRTILGTDRTEEAINTLSPLIAPQSLLMTLSSAQDFDQLVHAQSSNLQNLDKVLVKPITRRMLLEAVTEFEESRTSSPMPFTTPQNSTPKRLTGLRLLVVEDNKINQRVAQGLLAHEGAQISLAESGQEGIDAVQQALESGMPFDAVLMDIQMPGMDGYQATQQLRQRFSSAELPIIAMTANAMASDKAECLAAGMNDHISKPIDRQHLVQTLLRHCKTTQSETPPADSPQSPPSLPKEPPASGEIELSAALNRLGQDISLYINLVESFCLEQKGGVESIREALRQQDTQTAARIAHTLKGTAAALGANRLSQQAAYLEYGLRSQQNTPQIEAQLLTDLDKTLANSIYQLQTAIQQLHPEALPTPNTPNTLEPHEIRAQLIQLEQLLAAYNMKAVSVFAKLTKNANPSLQKELYSVQEALQHLDFATAQKGVAQLISSMKPTDA